MLLCSEDYAVEQYTAGSEGGATRRCGVRGAIRQQQGMYRPVACHDLHNMSQRAARRAPNNRLTVRRMNLIDVRAQRCCAPTESSSATGYSEYAYRVSERVETFA